MISLVITIAVLGCIVWAVTMLIPMPDNFKKAIYVIALICLAVFVLNAFGIWNFHDVPVPQLHER